MDYTLVIHKDFLGQKHIENNKTIIGANSEDAESQFWVDSITDPLQIEEFYIEGKELILTLINNKEDTLFFSIRIPMFDIAMLYSKTDIRPLLNQMKAQITTSTIQVREIRKKARRLENLNKEIQQNTTD